MPVVTNTINRPASQLPSDAAVVIELVGERGRRTVGYVPTLDVTVEGAYRPTLDANFKWSVTLVANELIEPANTVYKATERVDDVTTTHYFTVPATGGPYFVLDILDDSPPSLPSPPLVAHLNDTVDAHDASAVSFTPAGTIAATDTQAAIVEVATDAAAGLAQEIADRENAIDVLDFQVATIADRDAIATMVEGSYAWVTSIDRIYRWDGSAWNNLDKTYNPLDAGAVGDGVANDTAEILATITGAPDGAIITFSPGTYLTDGSVISGLTGRHFKGTWQSIIKRTAAASVIGFSFEDCDDISIEGLAFDANNIASFGGVNFLRCDNVRLRKNRVFDSDVAALGASDRYAFVFRADAATPSENIWVQDNLVEDLQLEVDAARKVWIQNNLILRSVRTGAIAVASITNNVEAEDYVIEGNTIVDPVGHGIFYSLDAGTTTGATFRRCKIRNNKIIFNTAGNNGIRVGTNSTSSASSGNTFTDIDVEDNLIWYAAGLTVAASPIFFASSATSTITFERCRVARNTITGNGSTFSAAMIDLRRLTDSQVLANIVNNGVGDGLSMSTPNGCVVTGNTAKVTGIAYTFNESGSTVPNKFKDNYVLGTPTTEFSWLNALATSLHREYDIHFEAGSLAFGTVNAQSSSSLDVTVTGAALNDLVVATPNQDPSGNLIIKAFVSAANTVRIRLINPTGGNIVSTDRTWTILVQKAK